MFLSELLLIKLAIQLCTGRLPLLLNPSPGVLDDDGSATGITRHLTYMVHGQSKGNAHCSDASGIPAENRPVSGQYKWS